ncbi:hypothetical protein [Nocardioides panzhihuensis]|uniref:Uncharacterized protein n=1 Tax=Nocardioides panzhihuensis TaxID=860243 RepID=A0A7Z0IVP8_9ACTN|nr:hypothetical protein [Nocardioides panzhihuensis]NYI81232.1 hypothetical protein [Nocardioides panzhihuensis]
MNAPSNEPDLEADLQAHLATSAARTSADAILAALPLELIGLRAQTLLGQAWGELDDFGAAPPAREIAIDEPTTREEAGELLDQLVDHLRTVGLDALDLPHRLRALRALVLAEEARAVFGDHPAAGVSA